ncbi:MAG: hypothetical protein ACR2ML_13975, partial [Solirubrobacteraceae bacterium]
MAIAHRNTQTASLAANGTALSVAKPIGLADGDVVVIHAVNAGGTASPSTVPTGFTFVKSQAVGTSSGLSVYIKVISSAAGEPATYGFAWGFSSRHLLVATAYSGVDNTTPQDAVATGQSNSLGTNTAPSITTVTADAWIVCGYAHGSAVTATWPAPMTEQADLATTRTLTTADEAIATAGATGTRTVTPSNSANNATTSMALRPASGGTTTTLSLAGATVPTRVGDPTLTEGAPGVTLSLGGASTATRVGAPTLTLGPVTLSLGGASTATRVGHPTLIPGISPAIIRVTRPPIGLAIEMRTPEGAGTTWDSHGDAEHIPKGISFSTRRGEGFAEGSCVLSRRVDREYPDLGLLDEAIIHGEDGSTAFEGRLAAVPRSYSEAHEVAPQFVGWMAHAKDRSITQIYVDRDPANWVAGSVERRQKWLDQG